MRAPVLVAAAIALIVGAAYWFSGPDPAGLFASATAEAERLYAEGLYEDSAAEYLRAEAFARDATDDRGVLSSRAQRGVCLKMLERADEARALLEPALVTAREMGEARIEGLALGNLARVESIAGNVDDALGYMDQLVEFSMEHTDERTEILTREQTAVLLDRLGRHEEALQRFDEALARHDLLDLGDDDRRDALLRQKGWTLVQLGDDFGARATWSEVSAAPTTLARQAQQLSMLGLHTEAAESALAAARMFEQETGRRDGARDAALALSLSELLLSGQLSACRTELEAVLAQAGDAAGRAPFELVAARLELTEGRPAEAAAQAGAARRGFGDTLRAQEAGWIEAVAWVKAAQPEHALDVLVELPDTLARTVLRGWIMDVVPDDSGLATEMLPLLDPARPLDDDYSIRILRRLCPEPLPSLAWLSLHRALSDADRLRGGNRGAFADAHVSSGIAAALHWHAAETHQRLTGRWPDAARIDNGARVDRWLDRQLAPDEAVIAVLPGVRLSYLVIFTSDRGGTTFGLPPGKALHAAADAVVGKLRGGSLLDVAHTAHELFTTLFDARALEDLAGRNRWSMMLPDELTSVPPSMWVTQRPLPNAPVAWLLRDHELSLMPLVLPSGLSGDGSPDGSGEPRPGDLARGGWVRMGLPTLDTTALSLAAAHVRGTYGDSALSTGALRLTATAPIEGGACTVQAVLEQLASADVVELSVPGYGGDRLAGLFLAPHAAASRGDAAAGFLPWRRIAESTLGADVILDRTRFDPAATDHGAALAAAALHISGSRQVLMTRWPVPEPLRNGMVDRLEEGADGSQSLAQLIGQAQRVFVAGAEQAGIVDRTHPLFWAGWLPFDAGP